MNYLLSSVFLLVVGVKCISMHGERALVTVPLRRLGASYVLTMKIGRHNTITNIVVDTGSAELILMSCIDRDNLGEAELNCYEASGNVSSQYANCFSLIEEGDELIRFSNCHMEYQEAEIAGIADSSFGGLRARNPRLLVAEGINITDKVLHPWEGIGGLLGLAPVGLSRTAIQGLTTFQQILANASLSSSRVENSASSLVGLDFRSAPQDGNLAGSMHLGGIHATFQRFVRWAPTEPRLDEDPAEYHTLRIFDPTLCGAFTSLLGQSGASSWPAMIDTGSDCLRLPSEFFDVFQTWAPVEYCGLPLQSTPISKSNRHLCYVSPATVEAGLLPWISFRVDDPNVRVTVSPGLRDDKPKDDSVGGGDDDNDDDDDDDDDGRFWIPLASLLLDNIFDGNGNLALCVERGAAAMNPKKYPPSEMDDDGQHSSSVHRSDDAYFTDDDWSEEKRLTNLPRFVSPQPPIVFGAVALRSLYVALDFDDKIPRVGLANKWWNLSSGFLTGNGSSSSSSLGNRAPPGMLVNNGCAAEATCSGAQDRYRRWDNECRPPRCERYYFGWENEEGTCAFGTPIVATGFILLVVGLGVMNTINHGLRERLSELLGGGYGAAGLVESTSGDDASRRISSREARGRRTRYRGVRQSRILSDRDSLFAWMLSRGPVRRYMPMLTSRHSDPSGTDNRDVNYMPHVAGKVLRWIAKASDALDRTWEAAIDWILEHVVDAIIRSRARRAERMAQREREEEEVQARITRLLFSPPREPAMAAR